MKARRTSNGRAQQTKTALKTTIITPTDGYAQVQIKCYSTTQQAHKVETTSKTLK